MSLYSHSKALFITSLACFSLGLQSELLAGSVYDVFYCDTGSTNCRSCNRADSSLISGLGQPIGCNKSEGGCSSCTSTVTGMFFDDSTNNDEINLRLDVNIPLDLDKPTYISFAGGNRTYITYSYADGDTVEAGSQFINSRDNDDGTYIFQNEEGGTKTIYLSNPNNNFTKTVEGREVLFVIEDVILQINSLAITGVDRMLFKNGALSVPFGGELSCHCEIAPVEVGSDYIKLYGAALKGGETSDTALIVSSVWSGIVAPYYLEYPGALILSSGYIRPAAGSFGGTGNILLDAGCVLQVDNSSGLGGTGGYNVLSSKGGALQFLGDYNFPNTLSFAISTTAPLYVDSLGHNASLNGTIYGNSSVFKAIILEDSSSTPGSLTLLQGSIPGDVDLYVNRGTLITSATSLSSYIAILDGATLQMGSSTYNASTEFTRFDVRDGSTLLLAGNSQVNAPMATSSAVVNINRKGSIDSSLSLQDAGYFSGKLLFDIDTGDYVDVTVYGRGYFGGTLDISPAVHVHYICGPNDAGNEGPNSYIFGPIKSVGTYVSGSSPLNGATLTIRNTNHYYTATVIYNGNISGNLVINIETVPEGSSIIYTQGYSITGCVALDLGCTLYLNDNVSTLTFVTNQEGTGLSQINGNIDGLGHVVVASNAQFGNSTSSYPTNRFTKLTLTSGTLGVFGEAALGGSSPTYIGNGGILDNKTAITMTLANPWIFNGGTTTGFQGGGSQIAFAITGSITTAGSGSATINGNADLTLTPSSLNIITGTSLLTNGTSVTTPLILGDGGLVLGGGTRSSPIDDTLTVTGASSYSGIISNDADGKGIVRIQSAVSLLGENTFTGGLYLDPAGTLTINTAANLGSGTIYLNGGGLTLPFVGTSGIVTADNFLNFTSESSTVFSVAGSSTGVMELQLTGNGTITGSPRTADFTVTGGGLLTIADAVQLDEGTYTVTIESGALAVNSTTTTLSYAPPLLNDGVLKGVQDSFFALADASYANWKVMTISDPSPVIMNVTVQQGGFLAGDGDVTTVVVEKGGAIAAGYRQVGVFTVTDSVVFESDSAYVVRTDGVSGSLLSTGGPTTIDPNVAVFVSPQAGRYGPATYVILSAGNTSGHLVGTFSGVVIPDSFFLTATLDYSVDDQVLLSVTPRFIKTGVTGSNAIAVAEALDKVVDWNRTHVSYDIPLTDPSTPPLLPEVLSSLAPLSPEEMTDALNQLQPAFFKGFTVVQENNIVKVQDVLTLRMDSILQGNSCYAFQDAKECCSPNEKRIHTWISGLGDVLAQESNTFAGSPQVGYQGKTYGFATGVDGTFAKFLYAGAMGGYTSSYIKWRGHQGTGNINTGYAGLYLSAIGKMFYGNLSLIGGFSDMSSKRHIEYTGVDLTASGNHSGKQLLSHADTGINFSFGGVTIKPFDAFDYVSQTENSYVEKGAGQWGLSLKKSNAILLRNELGLEVSTCLCFKSMKWVVAPKASWVREVRVKGQSYTASFTEAAPADAPFTVTGYFPDRSLFSPGICLAGSMCQDALSVEINYQGEFTHGYSDHSYGAEVRYSF